MAKHKYLHKYRILLIFIAFNENPLLKNRSKINKLQTCVDTYDGKGG